VLTAVSATSATNAWAVGYRGCCFTGLGAARAAARGDETPSGSAPTSLTVANLIEHWDGTSWTLQRSPNPGKHQNVLLGIAATSASDAWAVGWYTDEAGIAGTPFVEHWDGRAWSLQAIAPGNSIGFTAVSADSPTDMWAVGVDEIPDGYEPFVEHYAGGSWSQRSIGGLGGNVQPLGVAATSPTNVWAVGFSVLGGPYTLILHFNGTRWVKQASSKGLGSELFGVAATSKTNAFAVGLSEGTRTLVEHCCG
jgi:hypothetical protein